MDVELWPTSRPIPYPANPRENDAAVDAVVASLRAFGFRQPIVVDAEGVVVVGHTRLKAAKALGLAVVPVHVARDLTPEQSRAYRLADNQTAALSAWEDDRLTTELLALKDAAFDLALTGFAPADLDRLLADATASVPTGDPDAVPDPPADPETRPGDVWQLGRHRLVCGDATDPAAVAQLMDGELADLLLTDPPYNVAYAGKTADALTLANDDQPPDAYRRFLAAALRAAVPHLSPGGGFYLWHADLMALPTRQAVADAGLVVRQGLVWVKSAFTLGRADYQWRHEPCLYGWADGAAHRWFGGRDQSTVLEFGRPNASPDHPTPKPVALFETLVGNSCPPAGVVLDPFAGSGTTLVACERTGRAARLLELDPRYCDVIARRYADTTGTTPTRTPGEP